MPPAPSSSKALAAILPQVTSGQAYEAHQKARTFGSRYLKSGNYDVAIDVLFQSSRELLKAGHYGSGTDLGQFLLEVYDAKNEQVTTESRSRLTQLMALTGPSGSWRKTLVDKAIAWSSKAGPYPAGDPELHHYIGELLFKEGALDTAEPHLLASGTRDSSRLLAQLYTEWLEGSPAGTPAGPFALRATLPYLLNGNILAARTFLTQFITLASNTKPSLRSYAQSTPLSFSVQGAVGSESDEIVFTTDSALNFLQLAIRLCQRAQADRSRQAREGWVRLCGTYQGRGGVIAQPPVREALNGIATLLFAIPPPRNQAANPFGDLISTMFGGPGSAPSAPRVISPPSGGLD